ncbi:WRKY DNA-binding transcription factor 70-like [Impatiens glandulifera]|uniref:WRKY DNA-binding transcription factor 70-like n=1 Tax=Impatiens glandulifera TaxID=253017 RepID=UPI001FB0B1B4|nr:WRKY DNA-binding transcription factor 70-like [Impatiens glandulifera]
MDSPWTENHGGGGGGCRERAIEELIKGKDSLIRLKNFLQHRLGSDGSDSESTKELVAGISRSFTSVISMLNPDAKESQISDTTLDRKSMISDVTSKPPPTVKDRRGCYKRRKSEESWQKVSSTMEDGYAWRKYGQKEILNSNFPRCYFRCTHKYDQGCKALKQIQMMHDEPVRYKIIYIGRHSCTTTTTSPSFDQGLFACDVGPGESNCQFVSFETYNATPTSKLQQAHANYNLPVKEEVKEETMISDLCQDPVDSVAWNDFAQIESSSSALFRNYKTDGLGYFDQNQNVFNGFTNCSFSDFNDNFEFEEITNYSL